RQPVNGGTIPRPLGSAGVLQPRCFLAGAIAPVSFRGYSKRVRNDSKGIVSWPVEERPRERLLSKGAQALTDAELVAILIRVGFKGTSAVELGRQLLKQFGSLRGMVEAPVIALLNVKGLKGAKAAQLLSAIEIARRV